MKRNILFVCKYNRFRSKIAESIFNLYNKDKSIKAKSAGIIKGKPVDSKQKSICNEFGIVIDNPTKGLSTKLLEWQNIVIVVANDVHPSIFKDNKKYGKNLLIWKIKDAKTDNKKEVRKIIETVNKKVKKFMEEIKNDK